MTDELEIYTSEVEMLRAENARLTRIVDGLMAGSRWLMERGFGEDAPREHDETRVGFRDLEGINFSGDADPTDYVRRLRGGDTEPDAPRQHATAAARCDGTHRTAAHVASFTCDPLGALARIWATLPRGGEIAIRRAVTAEGTPCAVVDVRLPGGKVLAGGEVTTRANGGRELDPRVVIELAAGQCEAASEYELGRIRRRRVRREREGARAADEPKGGQ